MACAVRVLYVDDEPGLLEIVRIFLEKSGEFEVATVQSASAALDIIRNKTYDAIVSDFLMPEMDGIEFLKRVRAVDKTVPFILFTGRGREEVVIDAINNGADFYLQKGGSVEAQFAELAHKIRLAVQMKRTQTALAGLEQRYHDLQNANDLIQSVSPDGRFLFVNNKWLDTLGYSEEDLPGLTLFDVIDEESLGHCRDTFRQVIAGENVGIIDAVFRTRDGKKVYVEGMADCKMTGGTCQYTRGIFKDITDRKRAESELVRKNDELKIAYEELTASEEELRQNYDELRRKEEVFRESEEKFRALVELSLDGILIIDFTGNLLFANQAAGLIVDAPDYKTMIGIKNVMDFIDKESRADVLRDIGKVFLGIDAYLVHYKLVTATKREVWVELIGKKIAFGDSSAILVSMRDVTERRRADDALQQVNKKLNLLSGITRHDITNQLLTLNGYITLLHKKIPDPQLNDYFSRITVASRQIENLIQFTREYEMVGVHAPAWQDIRTLIDTAGRDAMHGKVTLKNDLPAGTEVFADPLIVKVFFNLLDNALRHGGKITTIRFSLEERGGDRVIVCADDGDGIRGDEKGRIFERGFGRNTGFGLAISREILDITGITIKETGEPGSGARFEITVPKGQLRPAS